MYNLLSNEFDVHVVQLAYKSKIRDWERPSEKLYKEYLISFDFIEVRNRLDSLLKIYRLAELVNPSIIITHGYHRFEYLLIPFLFRDKVNICEVATTFADRKRNIVIEKIKFFILNSLFRYFLVYGKLSFDYLIKLGLSKKKIFVKGNFSHLQLIDNSTLNWENRDNQVLFVGRLSEEKNLINLVKSFINYRGNTSNYKLVIIGSGPQKDQIINLVIQNEASDYIEIYDKMPIIDLIPIYLKSKLFVLPSFSESWGQVINEAMHFGLPILISNKCGASMDLCDVTNSVSFDPEVTKDFSKLFCELLHDNEKLKKMGDSSIEKIKSFHPVILNEKLNLFLNSTIGNY